MQRLTRLREQPERGVSAVIVAIVMLVLLGFTGLGVDVTAAYAKSQEVQNAADAAALAAAQECAGGADCPPGAPEDSVRNVATRLATNNMRTDIDPVEVQPDGSRVTVTVKAEHQNFFASIFGVDTFPISRSATAGWSTPSRAMTFLPVVIGECEYDDLGIADGEVFTFKLYKTSKANCPRPNSGNLMPGGFGYVGEGQNPECKDITRDLNENGGWIGSIPGNSHPRCDYTRLEQMVDNKEVVLVPIFDECRTGNGNGSHERCLRGSPEGYRIKGFAAVELHGYKFSGSGQVYPTRGADKIENFCSGNERCLRGRFVEWVDLADAADSGSAPDFGVRSVRLIAP